MAELGYFVVPSSGKPYILLNDIFVELYPTHTRVSTRSSKISGKEITQYFKGTLLREVETTNPRLDLNKILCRNPESEVYVQCSIKDLEEISENVYELLRAISNCRDRLEVFRDGIHIADGLEMEAGTNVYVKLPNLAGELQGIIRYKGEVRGKDGIQFGVELYNADGKGTSNGSYAKERYFNCDADTGVFLPLNRVRPLRNRNESPVSAPRRSKHSRLSTGVSGSRGRSSPETCPLHLGITRQELENLGISIGMEVYIFTEVRGRESQEKGKVKFIGRLPGGNTDQIYVGIDLDKGVGNGTGLYNGKHLFYTKQNHAALVPLSGVLPAYVADTKATPESSSYDRHSPVESRKAQRAYNTNPCHGHRDSALPPHIQRAIYPPSTGRVAYSSPSILEGRDGRVEEYPVQETNVRLERTGSNRSSRSSRRSSPMETLPPENARPEAMETSERSQRISGRRPIRTPDSSGAVRTPDSSGDETDLYGSDNSVLLQKVAQRKDMAGSTDQRSATVPSNFRPLETASVPGDPELVPMVINQNRSKTVPGYERKVNGRLPVDVVPFSSIANHMNNSENEAEMRQMEVGTMVQVSGEAIGDLNEPGPTYGVIKWIGTLPNNEKEPAAGIELERPLSRGTDGTFNGVKYFSCDPGRGHFVFLKFCQKDPRFSTPGAASNLSYLPDTRDFGSFDSPDIPGKVPPPRKLVRDMVGKKRGIQGHHNSCYLDSTLFSLFAYSQVLDTILFRRPKANDLPEYGETQKVLKDSIVNPLRKHHFVRADRIMKLRQLLDKLGSTTGLVNEEKDPEEFLNTLLNQVFKAEPLHELRQGNSIAAHEGYFYQIFMERDEKFQCPSTQQLLEKSLVSADLKFRNVPVCLILQMPRFGKDYKMYKKVRPSLQLDITNLVEDMPRTCDVCETFAEYECRECFMEGSMNEPIISFCKDCAGRLHNHRKRKGHDYRAIKLPDEFRERAEKQMSQGKQPIVQRQTLELFAVVCIATSHYVSFAKCGSGKNAAWVFFDSMADRVGEENGYNIPQITPCPEFENWLNQDESLIRAEDEKLMPELKRRLLCDSYMCMYQSRELMCNK